MFVFTAFRSIVTTGKTDSWLYSSLFPLHIIFPYQFELPDAYCIKANDKPFTVYMTAIKIKNY